MPAMDPVNDGVGVEFEVVEEPAVDADVEGILSLVIFDNLLKLNKQPLLPPQVIH